MARCLLWPGAYNFGPIDFGPLHLFFLNSSNFVPHPFLTLVPPSGHALNVIALIKVSKVICASQLLYQILRSSFERKFDIDKIHFSEKTFPNIPRALGLSSRSKLPFINQHFQSRPLFYSGIIKHATTA